MLNVFLLGSLSDIRKVSEILQSHFLIIKSEKNDTPNILGDFQSLTLILLVPENHKTCGIDSIDLDEVLEES